MTADGPAPTAVVADADVLAADLLVGGPAREALDLLRAHSWTTLVASDALLADARAVIEHLAEASLAADWEARVDDWRHPVEHPPDDHPALASAFHGGAAHLLTLDDALTSAETAAAIRPRIEVSIRRPEAFVRLFDPDTLYPALFDAPYPGADRDPRA